MLLEFIRGIARYEKMENEVVATPEVLEREMFDEHRAEAVFAVVDGREVGFALYFYNFSTFIGHSGLYLEDLFVWPEDRGKGYGKSLLLHLVKIAREHHCGRMEWTCLNWLRPWNGLANKGSAGCHLFQEIFAHGSEGIDENTSLQTDTTMK